MSSVGNLDAEMYVSISSHQVKYRYGKGYEEICEVAASLNKELKNPQSFCDTRFAQSELKVYINSFPQLAHFLHPPANPEDCGIEKYL